MSWDRVIQDSDEEEPLAEEEIPTSIHLPQGHEAAVQQQYDLGADHQAQAHYPIEHHDANIEPQLNVNFDHFLQSQEFPHVALNSSQQRREERWIPSTGEGGGGSIGTGAMMTEIGLAQQRLFDDEASSVAQRLPSTATYSSEISQPGSFPIMPKYPYQQTGQITNDTSNSVKKVIYPSYEATQLVPSIQSVQAHGYEYSTPAASTTVDSPLGVYGEIISYPTTIHTTDGSRAHPSQKATQRSKSLQSQPYSPHDTEPLSSVASPGLNRAKSDNVVSGLMSPRYSEADARDELSLPAVSVEVTTVQKRGPPKKQSVLENDDDDELAIVGASETTQSKPEKRKPGRPPKSAANGDAAMNNTVVADAETPTAEGVIPQPEGPVKAVTKETKKRKVRRSKTADALMQKSRPMDDDDVIWIDSRPIQTEANSQNGTKPVPEPTKPDTPLTETLTTENTQSNQPEEQAPKKRGRKRKKTSEQTTVEAETSKNQAPDTPAVTDTPIEKAEQTPDPPIPDQEHPAKSAEQTPQPDTIREQEPLPQTPQPNSKTKPGAHSPILSTSKVPYRVGLSKRARIAPLLKVVRK